MKPCRMVVHDINNQICVISALASMLKESELLSERGIRSIDGIIASAFKCSKIIEACVEVLREESKEDETER